MKLDVIKLDASPAGSIELDDAIFGLEPRADILHRVVRWQLAKRQAGTHSTLGKSEVSYSTKKIVRQKGSGGARHGSRKSPTFRHGGTYKGPVPRSHAHDLTKKFRALGLKHALSAKAQASQIVVVDLRADGPVAREYLATATGSDAPSLSHVCRARASVGTVALAPPADLPRAGTPDSLRPLASMCGEEQSRACGELRHTNTTGPSARRSATPRLASTESGWGTQ